MKSTTKCHVLPKNLPLAKLIVLNFINFTNVINAKL
jgi:hypothetical protein